MDSPSGQSVLLLLSRLKSFIELDNVGMVLQGMLYSMTKTHCSSLVKSVKFIGKTRDKSHKSFQNT